MLCEIAAVFQVKRALADIPGDWTGHDPSSRSVGEWQHSRSRVSGERRERSGHFPTLRRRIHCLSNGVSEGNNRLGGDPRSSSGDVIAMDPARRRVPMQCTLRSDFPVAQA
jgi:hypothetical protein